MRVVEAEFLSSGTADAAGWPLEGPPEVAFAGRSNVGKSTLLQALLGRRGLVRVSSTPGRTRLINFFRLVVDDGGERREWRFVDLPGYGYAKVSKAERMQWRPFIERYLGHRRTLRACVLLIDGRRVGEVGDSSGSSGSPPSMLLDETELARWIGERSVPVIPVLTKADQLSKHERKPAAERLRRILGAAPLVVSATEGDGLPELWRRLTVALAERTV